MLITHFYTTSFQLCKKGSASHKTNSLFGHTQTCKHLIFFETAPTDKSKVKLFGYRKSRQAAIPTPEANLRFP